MVTRLFTGKHLILDMGTSCLLVQIYRRRPLSDSGGQQPLFLFLYSIPLFQTCSSDLSLQHYNHHNYQLLASSMRHHTTIPTHHGIHISTYCSLEQGLETEEQMLHWIFING